MVEMVAVMMMVVVTMMIKHRFNSTSGDAHVPFRQARAPIEGFDAGASITAIDDVAGALAFAVSAARSGGGCSSVVVRTPPQPQHEPHHKEPPHTAKPPRITENTSLYAPVLTITTSFPRIPERFKAGPNDQTDSSIFDVTP